MNLHFGHKSSALYSRHYGYEEMLQKVQGDMLSVKEGKETLGEEKLDLVQEVDTKEIISDNDGDKKEEMDEKPSCNAVGIRVKDFGNFIILSSLLNTCSIP